MTETTIHAHVSTYSRDCDGGYSRDYVMVFNDEEKTERETAQGVNDFSDIHFMNRVLCAVASPYACDLGMTVKMDNAGIEVHENTDEGYREALVRWCRDDCHTDDYSFRDHSAEAAGY